MSTNPSRLIGRKKYSARFERKSHMRRIFPHNSDSVLLLAAIFTMLLPSLLLAQSSKKKENPPPAKAAPASAQKKTPATKVQPPRPPIDHKRPVIPEKFHPDGRPKVPPRGTSVSTKNGSQLVKRSNGKVSDIHNAQRNMDIHHSLNGTTRVSKTPQNKPQVVAVRRHVNVDCRIASLRRAGTIVDVAVTFRSRALAVGNGRPY